MHWSRYLSALPELTLTGVIDILIVAFLLYQSLLVVRGTRAGHILIGILMMVFLYAVAVWAGLEALRSLLSFIVPYLGLAIIVLFQSEIRRTLARIGRKRWFSTGFRAPESIHEIVLAVEQLAAQKTGALIVLERDIGLRTFVESGVRMDALISRDLLLSIFRPGLPLHDGAAIVQKDRIAACRLWFPKRLDAFPPPPSAKLHPASPWPSWFNASISISACSGIRTSKVVERWLTKQPNSLGRAVLSNE